MVFRHFRFVCIFRVIVLSVTIFVCILLSQSYMAVSIALILAALYQIRSLIRYVEKTNRDLTRFIEAIKYEDTSQSFKSEGRGGSFISLNTAFSDVTKEIRQARSEKEEQVRTLETVIQHIGIGLISFKPDGEIQLINNAAKRLLRSQGPKNITSFKSFSEPLIDTLFRLTSGERALVKVDLAVTQLQLALNATEFVMRGQKYTLVTIQNIQSELERERMARELEIAHQVQMSLLPKTSPDVSGFDIAGVCIPAEEVGGDYFDYIPLSDGRLGVAVGDVSGKGMPAAIYMTLTKGVIQSQAEETLSPGSVLTKINSLIYQSIERKAFVSMFYAVLNPKNKTLICSRAGHNPAILVKRKENSCTVIQPPGIALGLESGDIFSRVMTEETIQLESGDLFVLHTDGFTEAMDKNNSEYGEARLTDVILKNRNASPRKLIDAVSQNVHAFTANHPQHDDMTMVVIRAD